MWSKPYFSGMKNLAYMDVFTASLRNMYRYLHNNRVVAIFLKADIFYQPFFVKILLIIPQSINPHVKSNNKRYRRF